MTGELTSRETGEVYVTFADDPPNGPRLRIAATAARVLITVQLLALVDAGESPWAEIRDAGRPGEGDPHGYRGAVLSIEADGGPVTYRIGEYVPSVRCYVAERAGLAVERVADEDAARRLTLYGSCLECGAPRDVRTTTEADGSALMDMFCPACGYS